MLNRERLVDLIKEHVAELASEDPACRVTHISFIGYSMGGLVARYAVGKLEYEVGMQGREPMHSRENFPI